jgi:hypothetical protein
LYFFISLTAENPSAKDRAMPPEPRIPARIRDSNNAAKSYRWGAKFEAQNNKCQNGYPLAHCASLFSHEYPQEQADVQLIADAVVVYHTLCAEDKLDRGALTRDLCLFFLEQNLQSPITEESREVGANCAPLFVASEVGGSGRKAEDLLLDNVAHDIKRVRICPARADRK